MPRTFQQPLPPSQLTPRKSESGFSPSSSPSIAAGTPSERPFSDSSDCCCCCCCRRSVAGGGGAPGLLPDLAPRGACVGAAAAAGMHACDSARESDVGAEQSMIR